MKKYATVLSIAGSDPSGGAGIQADIKAISACGGYAMTAITAITVQNTIGVTSVFDVPENLVVSQIEAVLSDIGADAVKIGMLPSSSLILSVCDVLSKYNISNIVVDPVMVSTSGHKLINDDAIDSLKRHLLPMARVITPNLPEAEVLLGEALDTIGNEEEFARRLSYDYRCSVLLKGGHKDAEIIRDALYCTENDTMTFVDTPKISTMNTHGTGCTLSASLAAFLARGFSLSNAFFEAKSYITNAINAGADYRIGHGHGPVCHFPKD